MVEQDIIMDANHMPAWEEIEEYINLPVRELWKQFNNFVQERYKASPKIMYSVCSGKPGWNVKYQKSGKSLCTLYPEKDGFTALIVVTLDLMPLIEALYDELTGEVVNIVKSARSFNGTKWLMLKVGDEQALRDVKQLLLLKHEAKRPAAAKAGPVA